MSREVKTGVPEFGYGEDEALLRDVARQLLDEKLPIERLRRLVAADHEAVYARGERPGWDPELWREIVELGWTGLAVPVACGGAGLALVGIAGIVEEAGRHALPAPLEIQARDGSRAPRCACVREGGRMDGRPA